MIENDILSVVLWLWATICLTTGLWLVVNSILGGQYAFRNSNGGIRSIDSDSILRWDRFFRLEYVAPERQNRTKA